MLNFRNTNLCALGLMILLLVLRLMGLIPGWPLILLSAVYVVLLIYGSYSIGSGFYFKAACSVQTTRKEIAISFDDGPDAAFTADILDILRKEQIPAAFFCIGSRVDERPDLCRQMMEDGHLIGNHSYSHHFWFDLFSPQKMLADLREMDRAVKKATGLTPRLFRPPYGVTNPNLKKAVQQGGYIPVGWNIRSYDTVIKDEKKLLQKLTAGIRPGAIVLFHDTSPTTRATLPEFIRRVGHEGYRIVRLDKLLNLVPYA